MDDEPADDTRSARYDGIRRSTSRTRARRRSRSKSSPTRTAQVAERPRTPELWLAGEEQLEYTCSLNSRKQGPTRTSRLSKAATKPKNRQRSRSQRLKTEEFKVVKKQRLAGERRTRRARYDTRSRRRGIRDLREGHGRNARSRSKSSPTRTAPVAERPRTRQRWLPGEEQLEYTCSLNSRKLGNYTNVATVEGSHKTEKSPTKSKSKTENGRIQGLQEAAARWRNGVHDETADEHESSAARWNTRSTSRTRAKRSITVEKLTDPNCTVAERPRTRQRWLAGEEQLEYTCSRELTQSGKYTNVATVEGSHKTEKSPTKSKSKTENGRIQVFKKQRSLGKRLVRRPESTSDKVPATVEYAIYVKDTGETLDHGRKAHRPELHQSPKGPEHANAGSRVKNSSSTRAR